MHKQRKYNIQSNNILNYFAHLCCLEIILFSKCNNKKERK